MSELSGRNLCQSATSILSIDSDIIFAIQLSVSSFVSLSIVGVYLPTTDSPLTLCKECLQELENVIFSLQTDGPVLEMGDFNVHIGQSYSDRVSGQTNTQGHLLLDLMNRTDIMLFHLVILPRALCLLYL